MVRYILVMLMVGVFVYANDGDSVKTKDIGSLEEKSAMKSWLESDFMVKPYRVNYILPYSARQGKYKSYVQSDHYESVEAELQVSLKLKVGSDMFGLNEDYYVSYTHQGFWQLYAESAPFRETTYNPEIFVVFPVSDEDSMFGMKSVKIAYAHRSNGQGSDKDVEYKDGCYNPGNRSRSVNYFYSTFRFQHKTLITDFTAWVPIVSTLDDNPDLMDYTGYTSLKFHYFIGKNMFTLMGRANLSTGYGAIEGTYSYPLRNSGAYLYVKIFSGYTESLIDYNNNLTKFSIGFSFSR